ncbi:unnamed protein product, partial [marine sediment metagenome]
EADKQKAIDIARADPRVRELLDRGANISNVSGMLAFVTIRDIITGETREFSETLARVEIQLGDDSQAFLVNLTRGIVIAPR